MNIPELHALFKKSKGVATDTRTLREGELFFCLKGANFNGNRFANKALEKGAIAAIIDDQSAYSNEKTILVNNTLEALQMLAHHHRKQFDIPVIGLTGSNGKTTTKELIRSVLEQGHTIHATHGNLNNHIGVPLTLLGISDDTEIALIEMGANHQKEIDQLCQIAQPNMGYITNFGKAHLEGFGGVDGVIKGKSELYDYLRTHNGVALINGDDPLQHKQAKGIEQFSFGKAKENSFSIQNSIDPEGFCRSIFEEVEIKSNLTGAYNTSNINAAIAFGKYFKLENSLLIRGIKSYIPKNNRSQWISTNSNAVLLDAYNANPTSMLAALTAFDALDKPSKVLILGDMLELGAYAKQEHQEVVNRALEMTIETIMLVGPHFSGCKTKGEVMKFPDASSLLKHIEANPLKNKCILIKGSRGIALEQLLKSL